jgi:hypothetical protein
MLRIPRCLDNRLTDGGKILSLRTGRALHYYFYVSSIHFC